jgi:hypothetical protein
MGIATHRKEVRLLGWFESKQPCTWTETDETYQGCHEKSDIDARCNFPLVAPPMQHPLRVKHYNKPYGQDSTIFPFKFWGCWMLDVPQSYVKWADPFCTSIGSESSPWGVWRSVRLADREDVTGRVISAGGFKCEVSI